MCPATLLNEIARQGFLDALEIMLLIEVIERQNHGRIAGRLSDRGAGAAGIVVRNSLITRITVLVARCYARIHEGNGDMNLRRAFDEFLKQDQIRCDLKTAGTLGDIETAERLWSEALVDPNLKQIEHFRHKHTAHLAEPTPGMKNPDYGDFFAFARRTARIMEALAHGVGGTRETLDDHADDFVMSSQEFWRPWDRMA